MIPLVNALSSVFTSLLAAIWHCVPAYNPDAWNDGGPIENYNNCYNYACDRQTGTWAQPGKALGITLSGTGQGYSCEEVHVAAMADGLLPIGPDNPCTSAKPCSHRVALVFWPGQDYHWYRQDSNGLWSHKPGTLPATDLDNIDLKITDPRTANRYPYDKFCGFFCVDKKKISIE